MPRYYRGYPRLESLSSTEQMVPGMFYPRCGAWVVSLPAQVALRGAETTGYSATASRYPGVEHRRIRCNRSPPRYLPTLIRSTRWPMPSPLIALDDYLAAGGVQGKPVCRRRRTGTLRTALTGKRKRRQPAKVTTPRSGRWINPAAVCWARPEAGDSQLSLQAHFTRVTCA